jgi:hypothetical protein
MSRKQKNSVRSLTTIVGEIRGTFRNDIANIIKRGQLLQEAKDQLDHGEWLPWLQDKFEMDERTAQRANVCRQVCRRRAGYYRRLILAGVERTNHFRGFHSLGWRTMSSLPTRAAAKR